MFLFFLRTDFLITYLHWLIQWSVQILSLYTRSSICIAIRTTQRADQRAWDSHSWLTVCAWKKTFPEREDYLSNFLSSCGGKSNPSSGLLYDFSSSLTKPAEQWRTPSEKKESCKRFVSRSDLSNVTQCRCNYTVHKPSSCHPYWRRNRERRKNVW